MIYNISNSLLQYNAREIKRKAIELSFVFHTEKRFVSLLLKIVHYYLDDNNNEVYLQNLDYIRELIMTDNTLVYSDSGDYVEYEEVDETVQDGLEAITYKKKVVKPRKNADIIGEYTFLHSLRGVSISINDLVANIVTRADSLKMLD